MKKYLLLFYFFLGISLLYGQSAVYICTETDVWTYCYGKENNSACAFDKLHQMGGKVAQRIMFTTKKGFGAIARGKNPITNKFIYGAVGGYEHLDPAEDKALEECSRAGGFDCKIIQVFHDKKELEKDKNEDEVKEVDDNKTPNKDTETISKEEQLDQLIKEKTKKEIIFLDHVNKIKEIAGEVSNFNYSSNYTKSKQLSFYKDIYRKMKAYNSSNNLDGICEEHNNLVEQANKVRKEIWPSSIQSYYSNLICESSSLSQIRKEFETMEKEIASLEQSIKEDSEKEENNDDFWSGEDSEQKTSDESKKEDDFWSGNDNSNKKSKTNEFWDGKGTAREEKSFKAQTITNKSNQFIGEIRSKTKRIRIVCFDHGQEDGDRVQILNNTHVISRDLYLTNAKKEIIVNLNFGMNRIDFKALSEGSNSPNTATFAIYDDSGKLISEKQWNILTGFTATLLITKL